MNSKRFRVALSFPGKKRKFVRKVAEELAAKLGRERVLYDEYLTAELAQPDLDLHLSSLYREESELIVPFFCADYERKKWCGLELRQMRDMHFNREGRRIMPFRFDKTEIPGVLSIDGYVDVGKKTPLEVASLILQRVGVQTPLQGQDAEKNKKNAPKRRFWIFAILAVISFLVFGVHRWMQPKPFPSNVTGVLILRITGDSDGSLQTRLISSLNAELSKNLINKTIELRGCNEIVDENGGLPEAHERARKIGQKFGAEIVVWGNKGGEARFFPRITTVRSQQVHRERTFSVQDIGQLNLPIQTIGQPLFLAHSIAGFSFLTRKEFQLALNHFEAARNSAQATPDEMATLQLLIGLIHFGMAEEEPSYLTVAIGELSFAADFFNNTKGNLAYIRYSIIAQIDLGCSYRRMGSVENINRSISAFKSTLRICNETNFPVEWAIAQDELGVSYSQLPTKTAEDLKDAIDCFENALRVFSRDAFPAKRAQTLTDLGYAYSILPYGDFDENFKRAISTYKLALTIVTEAKFPIQWADAEQGLGLAYLNSRFDDSGQNIHQAIECFQAVLRVQTRNDFPREWANTESSLAVAYLVLPAGDHISNVNKAIATEELVITVCTKTNFPKEWAEAQVHLGLAFAMFPNGSGATNGLAAYTKALEVFNKKDYPYDWAKTQDNLGRLYQIAPGDPVKNLKLEIESYENALTVFTEKDFPHEWATTEQELGSAYGLAGDYLRAIDHLTASLRVIDMEHSPEEWATVQLYLGLSFGGTPMGNHVENLLKAKNYFSNTFKVWGPTNSHYEDVNKYLGWVESELKMRQRPK